MLLDEMPLYLKPVTRHHIWTAT